MLGALAVFALVVLPLAVANAGGGSDDPGASASASTKKKIKKLTGQVGDLSAQVGELNQEIEALKGEQDDARPPTGPAGGDLGGSYPDPSIKANAVGSSEVADDSLTAADILEPSLGEVPSATNADSAANASTVDGVSARSFEYAGAISGSPNALMSVTSGLSLTAMCVDGDPGAPVEPDVEVRASTTFNSSFLHSVVTQVSSAATQIHDTSFNIADSSVAVDPTESLFGVITIVYRRSAPNGSLNSDDVTTVTLAYDETGSGSSTCQVQGTAMGGADIN